MEHQESHPNDAGAKPERHASAHGKIARRGCLLTILGLAIIVTLAVVSEYLPKAGMTEELARAQADAKAAGLAVTMSEFQRKYPSTAEGQKVVEKVAGVIELLKWDYDKFRFATTPVPADPKTTTTFDVVRLVSELSGLKTEQVTSPGLYAYVVANKAQLDEIAELGRSTAIDSLNCRHEFTADTPMRRLDTKFRKSGGGIFLSVRQASRVLLPAAIFVALAEDDSARAYNLLFGWFILSRSMKVSGTSLVEAMIGVAVDGIALEVANELLRASPPKDLPTALRLHDFLDQARMRRDFLQGLEAGAIYSSQMLWHLIDERHVLPPGILKMETGFKESAQKDVARSLNELWASLTRGRRGPTLPSLAVWRIAAFGPSISELQECIAILTESVTRLDKLLSTTRFRISLRNHVWSKYGPSRKLYTIRSQHSSCRHSNGPSRMPEAARPVPPYFKQPR